MFTSLHSSEPKSSVRASAPQRKDAPFFQAKLTVNTPGDAHEQEADRVADQVMRMREGDAPIVQRMPLTPVSNVMRACAECEKEKMQRKETGGGDASGKAAPSIVSDVLSSGSGQPMESGTRQFMESRFGQDFSQVRIHTDSRAAESASAIQARAYTSGQDVVFGAGEYQPSSDSGRRLLAHELVHVGQQGGGGVKRTSANPTQSKRFPADIDLLFSDDLQSAPNKGLVQRKATGSQQSCPTTCPPGSASVYRPVSSRGFNCYAYAMNSPSSGFLQPGQIAQTQEFKVAQKGDTLGISSLSAAERLIYLNYHTPAGVARNSEADLGARFTSNCNNCCPPGTRKIVAVTTNSLSSLGTGMSWDHHWYRKDADGAWSHKRGQTPSTREDATGATPLCNPCTASRNYGNLNYSNIVGSWCLS